MKGLLTIATIMFSMSLFSQEKSDVVIMKIHQNYTIVRTDSYIRVTYSAEESKTIELKTAGRRMNDAEEDENSRKIQKAILELIKEGYEVVSSSVTGDFQFTTTLIVFQRRV